MGHCGSGLPAGETAVEIWPLFRPAGADAIEATLAASDPPGGLVVTSATALMVGDQFMLRHTGEAGRAVWLCTVTRSTRLAGGGFRLENRGVCVLHDREVGETPAGELLTRVAGTMLRHLACEVV